MSKEKGKNNITSLGNEVRRRETLGFSSSGQMFILSAVFIVLGLILIFNVLGVVSITEEKRFQEGRLLDKAAKNVLNEYIFALGVATTKPKANESARDLLANFSSYLRNDMNGEFLYAAVFVNGTTLAYSVNVGNFLDSQINITVNVTSSTPSSLNGVINDTGNKTFSFTSDITGIVNVTLFYVKGNANVVEKFPINVSSRNFAKGFFDLTVRDGSAFIRVKEDYNRTW